MYDVTTYARHISPAIAAHTKAKPKTIKTDGATVTVDGQTYDVKSISIDAATLDLVDCPLSTLDDVARAMQGDA